MRLITTLSLTLLTSVSLFSQQNTNGSNSNQVDPRFEGKMIESSQPQPLTPEMRAEYEKKLAAVESHIKSIQIKREHVMKDPEMKAEAEQKGWFEDMKATEARLEERKKALQAILEKN
jgi:hypothetical protein